MDSVELEQLALLFSRLDTDHDGVLMFGEFLPAHLPPILLPSSSHPPPILLSSSSVSFPSPGEFCQFILLVSRWLPAHYTEKELRHMFHKSDLNGELRLSTYYYSHYYSRCSLLTTLYLLLSTLYSLLTTTSAGDDLIDLNEFVHMQWQAGRLDVQSQRSQVTQSINQPVDQSVNQPVSKPVNQ